MSSDFSFLTREPGVRTHVSRTVDPSRRLIGRRRYNALELLIAFTLGMVLTLWPAWEYVPGFIPAVKDAEAESLGFLRVPKAGAEQRRYHAWALAYDQRTATVKYVRIGFVLLGGSLTASILAIIGKK